MRQIQALARDLSGIVPDGPFRILIGGSPGYYNDFSDYMWKSFPKVFGFVILTTLALLFAAFRSFILPLKAVLANLLAIAAGYGAVVAIFQFGWLHGMVGLEKPFASIPLEVPLMIFCLSFGLSMDYELFLLFRIQRQFLLHGDNDRATVEGLAAVGPVITGAGLIMTAVFGAFVSADPAGLENDRRRSVRGGARRCNRDPRFRRPRIHVHRGTMELVSGRPQGAPACQDP